MLDVVATVFNTLHSVNPFPHPTTLSGGGDGWKISNLALLAGGWEISQITGRNS